MNSTSEQNVFSPSETHNRAKVGSEFQMLWLSVVLALSLATPAPGQSYTVLKSFGVLTNVSGYDPQGPLVRGPDGALYGTASNGEWPAAGTVFKLNSDGTGF